MPDDVPPAFPEVPTVRNSPPVRSPRLTLALCAFVALLAVAAIAMLEFGGAKASSRQAHPSPRLIHSHGSSSSTEGSTVTTKPPRHPAVPTRDVYVDFDDTGEWFPADLPPSTPVADAEFDDGREDPLARREAMMETWRAANSDLWWNQMDTSLRTCVHVKYVNGFMNSPEDALDECLALSEREDAEREASLHH